MDITLSNEQFKNFINSLAVLKDMCNDVDIKGGVIRQHTNSRYCLFEIDLHSLIGNVDIPIIALKKKLDILKIFKNSENVTISVDDITYAFSDNFSKIRFNKLTLLDNRFITEDELANMFELNPDNLIIDCNIDTKISNRIKSISQNFDVNTFKINFENNKASILFSCEDKSQEAVVLDNIDIPKDLNASTNIFTMPFIIDHDEDIKFELYEVEEDCAGKVTTKNSGIEIVIYTNAILMDSEEEEELF